MQNIFRTQKRSKCFIGKMGVEGIARQCAHGQIHTLQIHFTDIVLTEYREHVKPLERHFPSQIGYLCHGREFTVQNLFFHLMKMYLS